MKSSQQNNVSHLFICTHEREAGESCAQKNSFQLMQNLKAWAKTSPELKGRVKVTRCGCLGKCSEGIAAIFYPQQELCTEIRSDDETLIQKKILEMPDLK